MAKVTINESTLQALADKIREKIDDTVTMTPNQMVNKINTDLYGMELINSTAYDTLSPKKNKLYLVPAVETPEVKEHYQVANSIDVTTTCDKIASGEFLATYYGVNIDTLTIQTVLEEGQTYITNVLQQIQPTGNKLLNIRKIIIGTSIQIQPTSFLNLTTVEEMEFYSFPTGHPTSNSTNDTYVGMFNTCTSLTKVILHSASHLYNEFKGHTGLVDFVYDGSAGCTLYDGAFEGCTNLTHISGNLGISKGGNTTLTTNQGDAIFKGCIRLTSTLDDSVRPLYSKCISNNEYENCYSLRNVSVAGTWLLSEAFLNCVNLETVKLTDFGVFGESIFKGCTSLHRVEIVNTNMSYNSSSPSNSSGVPTLCKYMFQNCTSLTDVILTNSGIQKIENYVFSGCTSLTSLTIATLCPVLTLADKAFSFEVTGRYGSLVEQKNTTLQTINLYNTPITAFSTQNNVSPLIKDMTGLTSITLPQNLAKLDISFQGCTNLNNLVIPDSVTSIVGTTPFKNCTSLTNINWGNSVIDVEPDVANQATSNSWTSTDYTSDEYMGYFIGCPYITSTYTLPTNFNGVANCMFKGCTSLTNLTLGNNALFIGYYGCAGDTALTTVTMTNNLTTIYGYAFSACYNLSSLNLSTGITEIGHSAFTGCTSLNLDLTDLVNLTWIGPYAFRTNTSMTSVTINNTSPLALGNYCFLGCTGVTAVSISGECTYGNYVFSGCTSLVTVNLPEITTISTYMFNGCSSLTNSTVTTLMGLVSAISNGAFKDCTALTSLTLPTGITWGSSVFYNCSNLAAIQLPSDMSTIPSSFLHGTAITSIDLTHVEEIGAFAFSHCTSLASITLPSSSLTISANAFEYTAITSITLPSTITLSSSGSSVFSYCTELVTATINATLTPYNGNIVLPSSIFSGCTKLEEVTVNTNITHIGAYAFSGCTSLTTLHLPATLTTINSSAFNNCSALTDVYFAGTQAQWNSITINSTGNDPIILAKNPNLTIHYES